MKYPEVILDRKLNWAEHLEAQCRRFTTTFWLCRKAFRRTWSLGPIMIAWLYSAIVKPRLLYAAVICWQRLLLKTVQAKMSPLQTLIFRGITCIPNREAWEEEEGKALLQEELWFTDGSKGRAGQVLDCTTAQEKEVWRSSWDSTQLFSRRQFSPSSTVRKR